MIFDKLSKCELYYSVHPNFQKAFDFIKKAVAEDLPVGKYEIEGKDLYASIQEYTTKVFPEGKFEGHEKYIDVQYIVSGKEVMEVIDVERAVANTEYNDVKDVTFYNNAESADKCVVEREDYGIFFPHDIHKPGMTFGANPCAVKKIVVKVKI